MTRGVSPDVQALLDEAKTLPDCAIRNSTLERAASRAESLGDLDTAWSARNQILSSSASHEDPRFEYLFMSLAWCLAVSDEDPQRFSAEQVLWQYKWVVTAAPEYASVPLSVLLRLVKDLDERFVRAGWGRRAGIHKQLELHLLIGQTDAARALIPQWRALPRDRGSDCPACETDTLVDVLIATGDYREAVLEARPIIRGRLSCATVPHGTFGKLLEPMTRLGAHGEAKEIYSRGRRLVAAMDEGGCRLASPYLLHAARLGEAETAMGVLRARLTQALGKRGDLDRTRWFGRAGKAMAILSERGVDDVECPPIPGIHRGGAIAASALAEHFLAIARRHAGLLDARNGNPMYTRWLEALA